METSRSHCIYFAENCNGNPAYETDRSVRMCVCVCVLICVLCQMWLIRCEDDRLTKQWCHLGSCLHITPAAVAFIVCSCQQIFTCLLVHDWDRVNVPLAHLAGFQLHVQLWLLKSLIPIKGDTLQILIKKIDRKYWRYFLSRLKTKKLFATKQQV